MCAAATLPLVIQGGMGIGVSNWALARAVSIRGQLGVVSGTAIDSLLVRRLQDGDGDGHMRRAMEHFPIPHVSADVLKKYFRPERRSDDEPYGLLPMYRQGVSLAREQITVLASFVEVFLAKDGHDGPVGMNLLTKVQMPNLASLYGAMLAGVDYVLMGAGIPKDIPGALDALAAGEPARMPFDVEGLDRGETEELVFEPGRHWEGDAPTLDRPRFLPIISSDSLARMLVRKANGRVDGFIVEGPTAGGHNAPPRGPKRSNDRGEPVYGERDRADLAALRDLGLPFWLAGGTGSPDGLAAALEEGAAGIQVGTLFAYADESGLAREYKDHVIADALESDVELLTDGRASPTGFPFKVVQLPGSNSEPELYEGRTRVCDLGYLRQAFRRPDGRIGYRCAAEPLDAYMKKGGRPEDADGRKCLCNALMADIGHGQVRDGGEVERPLITSGDEIRFLGDFLDGRRRYTAADALDYLLSGQLGPRLPSAAAPR